VEDLDAFQLANDLKSGIYALVQATQVAKRDWRFRDQLFDAAASVGACMAEGFVRRSPAEFSKFLGYSLSSLEEAQLWLRDGVARDYFPSSSIERLAVLGLRCRLAIESLRRTQERFKREGATGRRRNASRGSPPHGPRPNGRRT
jgi:four helix bundle protein